MALKVKDLAKWCETAIKEGYGDRIVLVAGDDEGNSFKQLYRGFSLAGDTFFIGDYSPMLHSDIDKKEAHKKTLLLE